MAIHDAPSSRPRTADAMDGTVELSVVVPVLNEEANLATLHERLSAALVEAVGDSYEIVFVDDGSTDGTVRLLEKLHDADTHVDVILLSRNFGHQLAITAGIDTAKGSAIVVIDGDLQDPPELIPKMVSLWRSGSDVVYAVRSQRLGEGRFKRLTATGFYRVLSRLTDIRIPLDAGDFRLMDRSVAAVLRGCREHNRYVRGLVAWAGFRQISLPYVRQARGAGDSKYPLRRMLRLAWDALTGFSHVPLKVATWAGVTSSLACGVGIIVVLLGRLSGTQTVPGWASVMLVLLFLGSVQLFAIGILGEYVSRVHDDVRQRPLYVVRSAWLHEGERGPALVGRPSLRNDS